MDVVTDRLRALFDDDSLAVATDPEAVRVIHDGVSRRRRLRRLSSAVVGVTAVAAAAAGVAVVPSLLATDGQGPVVTAPPLSRSWTVDAPFVLPDDVSAVTAFAVSADGVWVGTHGRLLRVDPASGAVSSYDVAGDPQALAVTPHHLWLALRSASGCAVQLRDPRTVATVQTYVLPCGPGALLAATANGEHAWVATSSGPTTRVTTYDAQSPAVLGATTVPGAAATGHPLTIGGTTAYVLTARGLFRLVGLHLAHSGSVAVASDADRLAYGSGLLLVAGPTRTQLLQRTLEGTGLQLPGAADLTTGAGIAWTVVPGAASHVQAHDPVTARSFGSVVIDAPARAAVADGTDLWVLADAASGPWQVVRIHPAAG